MKLIRSCWPFGYLIFGLLRICGAAPVGNQPPKMPTFDEVNVHTMLSSVDEEYNFSLLKIGYFGGHIRSPFPAIDGFSMLKSTLLEQEMGSLKWFQLESIRGFASFHVKGIPATEGYDAYGLIFGGSFLATNATMQRIVQISVRDFVVTVSTSLNNKGLSNDSRTQSLLLKAWDAWHRMPRNELSSRFVIDWGRAVKSAHAQDKFTAIVEAALKDTAHPPDFMMLKLAVVVLQDEDPKRAIELLETAQKKMQPGDVTQQKWLYQTWTQLITGHDPNDQLAPKVTDKTQLTALVEMRRDQISYTGTGYAKLLQLYWQLEQYNKANELIMVVKGPGIRASQKIDVAKVLLQPFHRRDAGAAKPQFSKETISQLQEQGVALLQGYLMSLQENPPESAFTKGDFRKQSSLKKENFEIRARYELGRYFIKQDQITEALQALDIGDLKPTLRHTETAMYYRQILQMKAELAEKLKGIGEEP